MSFKRFLGQSAVAVAAVAACFAAQAQSNYPDKTVTIVVPFAAGGPTDTSARIVADALSKELNASFIVENAPGAGSSIGTTQVANKKPDGYTLLWGTGSGLTIYPHLRKTDYDPAKSFEPVSLVAAAPFVLVTQDQLNVDNVDEFVKEMKAHPGEFNFGSPGVGGTAHLIAELFNQSAGAEAVHIPYSGGAPMNHALMSGDIQYLFDTPTTIEPAIKSGKAKALAITSKDRWPGLPEVPTLEEQGFEDFDITTWFGLLAPAGTDAAKVQILSDGVQKALANKDVNNALLQAGFFVEGTSAQEFKEKIAADNKLWADLIKNSNIELD